MKFTCVHVILSHRAAIVKILFFVKGDLNLDPLGSGKVHRHVALFISYVGLKNTDGGWVFYMNKL